MCGPFYPSQPFFVPFGGQWKGHKLLGLPKALNHVPFGPARAPARWLTRAHCDDWDARGFLHRKLSPLRPLLLPDARRSAAARRAGCSNPTSSLPRPPAVHTFLIEAPDAAEAAALKAAIESAVERLELALQWLSKGLPLL